MATRIRCTACRASFTPRRDVEPGDRVRCPDCDARVTVPDDYEPDEDDDRDEDEEDEDDDRPRRKARRATKSGGVPVWLWVVIGVGLAGCAGAFTVAYLAYRAATAHPLVRAATGVPGLTEDNLKRLKVGMPESEVAGMFGPPNTSREEPNAKLIFPGPAGPGPVTKRHLIWLGNGGGLTAEFHNGLLAMAVGQAGEFRHAVQALPPVPGGQKPATR